MKESVLYFFVCTTCQDSNVPFESAVTLQRMASTYICERMQIRSHTQIYLKGYVNHTSRMFYIIMLTCVGVCCLTGRSKIIVWSCSKLFSVCERIR